MKLCLQGPPSRHALWRCCSVCSIFGPFWVRPCPARPSQPAHTHLCPKSLTFCRRTHRHGHLRTQWCHPQWMACVLHFRPVKPCRWGILSFRRQDRLAGQRPDLTLRSPPTCWKEPQAPGGLVQSNLGRQFDPDRPVALRSILSSSGGCANEGRYPTCPK